MTSFENENNVSFEIALDRTGYGLYSYTLTALTGLVIIAFSCIVYNTTIIVPASACELGTTSAQQGLLAAAPVVGIIVGTIIWGYLADRHGRRSTLLASLVAGAAINAVTSISVNWVMLMVMQFIAAILVSGQFPIVMTLLSESVCMSKRNSVVLLVTCIFLLAQGFMSVIAIPVVSLTFSYHLSILDIYWNSWRTVLVVYSIPSIVCAAWLYFLQESPKFVFAEGNEKGAIEILQTIHRINNKPGEIFEVSGLVRLQNEKETKPSPKEQLMPLIQAPLLKYLLITTMLLVLELVGSFLIWLPTIANQYMNILETGEGTDLTLCGIINLSLTKAADPDSNPCALNTTALLLVLAVGGLQSLANFGVTLVVDVFGRRNLVIGITAFTGVCGILVNLVPNAFGSAVFFVLLLLGYIVVGLYTAIGVGLFPTKVRAIAIAIPMTGGRVATFASIQILNFLLDSKCEVGFYVYSALFATSAMVASFLPDDRKLRPKQKLSFSDFDTHYTLSTKL